MLYKQLFAHFIMLKYLLKLLTVLTIILLIISVNHTEAAPQYDRLLQGTTIRSDVFTIEQFENLKTSITSTTNYPQGVSSGFYYTPWFINEVDIKSINVSNTGTPCTIYNDKSIFCDGSAKNILISYKAVLPFEAGQPHPSWYTLPIISPSRVAIKLGGYQNINMDFTLTVNYPSTLSFVDASIPPNMNKVTQRQLVWNRSSTSEVIPSITFNDPRIKGAWLPLVYK